MFKKRITPFACIVISLVVCIATFVAVSSYRSVREKALLNEERLEQAEFTPYEQLIALMGTDDDRYTKLAHIISMIEGGYIRDYDDNTLWDNVYKTLFRSIGDDYSYYLTAEEYEDLADSGNGNFVGIGVHAAYDVDSTGIHIFGVVPDSPAEEAGLLKNDVIINVEGIEADGQNYYDMLDAVRGEIDSVVKISVLRDGQKLDFEIVRKAVKSENIIYEKLDNGIAYFRILSFADSTVSEEFASKIAIAQSEGCDSFIFDVRNNGGGYLEEIKDVLDLLLPEGPIINIVDKDGKTTTHNSDANCIEGKMTVLCNDMTASAAELFTAALRDYEKAQTVGKTTFGKGSLQTTKLLSDGSAIKLSTAYYNPPSNVSYDKIGITPDFDVDLDEEWESRFFKMPKDKDAQLIKAIEILSSTN